MDFFSDSGFCPHCGSILPLPVEVTKTINCSCGYTLESSDCNNMIMSRAEVVFNNVKQKKDRKVKGSKDMIGPSIERICSQCGHNKMTYKTQQTRSADEGMTIFYYCLNCGALEKEDS